MDWWNIAPKIFDLVIIAGGAVFLGTLKTLKESNSALKERVEILESETKDCKQGHQDSQDKIKQLEDQINKTINIPLIKIEKHMDKTNRILSQLTKK